MRRVSCGDKEDLKYGSWTPEEDTALVNYINKHGINISWQAIANNAGLQRRGRSCRSRWINYLRPGVKLEVFTEEEDNIIFSLYKEKGNKWVSIASELPGRTDQAIKNYWNSKLRKRLLPSSTDAEVGLTRGSEPPVSEPTSAPATEEDSIGTPPCKRSRTTTDHAELGFSENTCKLACGPQLSPTTAEASGLTDFSEMVNWYVMSPPHDTVLPASASPLLTQGECSSCMVWFDNGLWWW